MMTHIDNKNKEEEYEQLVKEKNELTKYLVIRTISRFQVFEGIVQKWLKEIDYAKKNGLISIHRIEERDLYNVFVNTFKCDQLESFTNIEDIVNDCINDPNFQQISLKAFVKKWNGIFVRQLSYDITLLALQNELDKETFNIHKIMHQYKGLLEDIGQRVINHKNNL